MFALVGVPALDDFGHKRFCMLEYMRAFNRANSAQIFGGSADLGFEGWSKVIDHHISHVDPDKATMKVSKLTDLSSARWSEALLSGDSLRLELTMFEGGVAGVGLLLKISETEITGITHCLVFPTVAGNRLAFEGRALANTGPRAAIVALT